MKYITLAMIALLLASTGGCQPAPQEKSAVSYETVGKDPNRDTDAARMHNAHGMELLDRDDLGAAEAMFKTALAADMMFGPAHNNLGLAYYRQKKLYLAAWEFQYAARLMPDRIEPQNNLGMVYEKAGKLSQAAEAYEVALGLEPDNPEVIGNLCRTYVQSSRNDDRTAELLRDLVMKDTRREWTTWARERLMLMGKTFESTATKPAGPTAPVAPLSAEEAAPVAPQAEAVPLEPPPAEEVAPSAEEVAAPAEEAAPQIASPPSEPPQSEPKSIEEDLEELRRLEAQPVE